MKRYLQFIPLEDEILDFFRPVAARILQQLRAKAWLPTQPGKDGGQGGSGNTLEALYNGRGYRPVSTVVRVLKDTL